MRRVGSAPTRCSIAITAAECAHGYLRIEVSAWESALLEASQERSCQDLRASQRLQHPRPVIDIVAERFHRQAFVAPVRAHVVGHDAP